jgi:hypothetical protein
MKLDRAIKIQSDLLLKLKDYYSAARHYQPLSSEMNAKVGSIFRSAPKGTPGHVLSYLRGYRDALNNALYHDGYGGWLVYGGFVDGVFYSTHRDRDDYYEKHGIASADYADDGRVTARGHYWWKHGIKPYFTDEARA